MATPSGGASTGAGPEPSEREASALVAELALAVDTVIEAATADTTIFDHSPELRYFCTVLEELLRFGLKSKSSFFKAKPSDYWRVLEELGRRSRAARESIAAASAAFSSPTGRARSFIRRALAEKNLHTFLTVLLVENGSWTRECYGPESPLVQAASADLVLAQLRRLSTVDFDLKDRNFALEDSWDPKVEMPQSRRRAATVAPASGLAPLMSASFVAASSTAPLPVATPAPSASGGGSIGGNSTPVPEHGTGPRLPDDAAATAEASELALSFTGADESLLGPDDAEASASADELRARLGAARAAHRKHAGAAGALVEMVRSDYRRLQTRFRELQRDFDELCLQQVELRAQLKAKPPPPKADELRALTKRAAAAEQALEASTASIADVRGAHTLECQRLEQTIGELRAEVKQLAKAEAKAARLESKLERVTLVLGETKAQLGTVVDERERLARLHSHVETMHAKLLRELATARELAASAQAEKDARERATAELDEARASSARLALDADAWGRERAELICQRDDAQTRLSAFTAQTDALEAIRLETDAERAAAEARRAALEAELQAAEHAHAITTQRLAEANERETALGELVAQLRADARAAEAHARDAAARHADELALVRARADAGEAEKAAARAAAQSAADSYAASLEALVTEREAARALANEASRATSRARAELEIESRHKAQLVASVAELVAETTTLRERDESRVAALETARAELATARQQLTHLTEERFIRGSRDEDVDNCHGCGDAFSFFNRRHHCRKCGVIFCGSCSDKSAKLETSLKPVRVCRQCFDIVARGGPGAAAPYTPAAIPPLATAALPANVAATRDAPATSSASVPVPAGEHAHGPRADAPHSLDPSAEPGHLALVRDRSTTVSGSRSRTGSLV